MLPQSSDDALIQVAEVNRRADVCMAAVMCMLRDQNLFVDSRDIGGAKTLMFGAGRGQNLILLPLMVF